MLRKIRIVAALVIFLCVTLLFLDFTGALHHWLGWTAKIQFLPALLAMNLGVVIFLLILTLCLGRVYCSVICPLGVMQDCISWISGRRRKHRYRFSYSPQRRWLRYSALAVFIAAMMAGVSVIVALLAPYSSYGRIVSSLGAPLYRLINNLLATGAERIDSYAFYPADIWIKSLPTLIIAAVAFIVIAILAWRNGRTYCNTICPVGTVLSFLSRISLVKVTIDTDKCNNCGLCSRKCKAACIDGKNHRVDYSRCVACMDCLETCQHGAISLKITGLKKASFKNVADTGNVSTSRRTFIATAATMTAAMALKAQERSVDGGLAVIEDKKIPTRKTPIVPAGAVSLRNVADHCTACQLCISACPNEVLRPSDSLETLMQPRASYERGYCRPECTVCSDVCPTGAILPVTKAEKSSIQTGHAVWIKENCVVLTDEVECGNCARHCPAGAILMVVPHGGGTGGRKIPAVDTERCIGCGACENLCPARPFSAIYVEGHERHRII